MRPMPLALASSPRYGSSSRALRAQLALRLLQQQRRRRGGSVLAQGFTLIEIMVVVAIIGVLTAIALPNFNSARNAATVGARVGEALGFAKECSVLTITGVGDWTAGAAATGSDVTKGACIEGKGGTVTATWTTGAKGVKCGSDTSDTSDLKATITIDDKGAVSCLFGT